MSSTNNINADPNISVLIKSDNTYSTDGGTTYSPFTFQDNNEEN